MHVGIENIVLAHMWPLPAVCQKTIISCLRLNSLTRQTAGMRPNTWGGACRASYDCRGADQGEVCANDQMPHLIQRISQICVGVYRRSGNRIYMCSLRSMGQSFQPERWKPLSETQDICPLGTTPWRSSISSPGDSRARQETSMHDRNMLHAHAQSNFHFVGASFVLLPDRNISFQDLQCWGVEAPSPAGNSGERGTTRWNKIHREPRTNEVIFCMLVCTCPTACCKRAANICCPTLVPCYPCHMYFNVWFVYCFALEIILAMIAPRRNIHAMIPSGYSCQTDQDIHLETMQKHWKLSSGLLARLMGT